MRWRLSNTNSNTNTNTNLNSYTNKDNYENLNIEPGERQGWDGDCQIQIQRQIQIKTEMQIQIKKTARDWTDIGEMEIVGSKPLLIIVNNNNCQRFEAFNNFQLFLSNWILNWEWNNSNYHRNAPFNLKHPLLISSK